MSQNKAVFPIRNHSDTVIVQGYLIKHLQIAIDEGKPLVVRIDQKQDDRSSAQNRLYWLWLGQIEKSTGQDKDSLHFEFKKKFLLRLMYNDDQGFAEMCDSIARLRDNAVPEYDAISKHVIGLVSTTKCSVKMMTDYLNCVHDYAVTKLNIKLHIPSDLMWCYEG